MMKRLVDQELWLVSAVLAIGALVPGFLPYALLVALSFWPLRWIAYRRFSLRTPVDWAIGLLLLTLPITLWATSQMDITLPQVMRLCAGVVLFYAVVNGCALSVKKLRQGIDVTLAAVLLLAFAAPFVVQWNTIKLPFIPAGWYSRFVLMVSDPANPNVMAGSLILLLPVAVGVAFFSWKSISIAERGLVLGCLAAGSVMTLLTQSRGAWIGLGVSLLILISLRWRWGWLAGLAGLAAVGTIALLVGWAHFMEAVVSNTALGGAAGRLEVWTRAIYMVQDFPFTGIGMGTFTSVADRLYPFFVYPSGSVEHAHNLYLQVAVDLGLPGLVAWLAVWCGLSWGTWSVYRLAWRGESGQAAGSRWLAGLGAGLLASQLALAVHGLTDAVTWGMVRSAPLVWWVWGMAAALTLVSVRTLQHIDEKANFVLE